MIEVTFPCACGEEVMALIHKTEEYDETICSECGRKYRVYKPKMEEIK